MSWAMVAASAISAGVGIYQTQQGKKLAEQAGERPDYEIPPSVKSALGTSQLKALKGMPGAVKSQMLQEMDRARMASLSQVNERRGGLGVISQIEQNQQDSLRKMGIMDIEQREKNVQGLQDMRMKMAGYEESQQADKLASWEQQSQAAEAMKGAGMQNLIGAGTSLAMGAVSGLETRAANKKSYREWKATGGASDGSFNLLDKAGASRAPTYREWKKGGGLDRWNVQQRQQQYGGQGGYGGGQGGPGGQSGIYDNSNAPSGARISHLEGGGDPNAQQKIYPNFRGDSGYYSEADFPSLLGSQTDSQRIEKNLGFGGGIGSNEGMYNNIGLGIGMNKFDMNNIPSLQRQQFGAGGFGGFGGSTDTFSQKLLGANTAYDNQLGSGQGVLGDEWKKNFPLLYPEYQ
tara:strand:- start:17 stop:1228 length:1212 start_codon:yes stop_codon:yes gene_type:complete